ncbi:unnamed protein product [Cylicostephanus goldi]|uniref:Tyrosine-protein phosphatase domain-containing protein n=1 Tax=Cylicostephanus goldi TaxID=71465 RepID=A0A3P7LZ16_CYLGO|nr:unnamed protein product [Cylicostephanus goldi]
MLGGLAFYPSLGYNLLRNYIQPQKWCWFNRVDENLIVGALPFKSMRDELVNKENVGGVVCCVEDYELNLAYNAMTKEAGRTRSATVAVCYLVKKHDWLPNVAMEFLKSKRPQVCMSTYPRYVFEIIYQYAKLFIYLLGTILRNAHWRTANEYRRFLDHHMANDQRSGSL